MSDAPLFKNRYRVPSARWQGWDYGWNGWYFVTICTKDRACYFGDVVNKIMALSDVGLIVQNEWLKTGVMRENIHLDEWVIMPNHIHMVVETVNRDDTVETHCNASLRRSDLRSPEQPSEHLNTFGPQRNNLASIIRGFKGAVVRKVNQAGLGYFAWQPRYHDHVIRDEFELNRIRKYIRENPEKWENDELYV